MATYIPPTRVENPYLPFGDQRSSPFYGRDIISVKQFSRNDLEYIFGVAHEMREMVQRVGTFDLLKGKILANLFYEPSTRTSSSFTSAMERLGGSVIPINEVRHPEVGASALAARYARKPIINAGDGVGEHPTQALLDLFTIVEELGEVDGLVVTMLGDLKYGRTVHSLARLLSLYNIRLNYVSPDVLRMPAEIIAELNENGISQTESAGLDGMLPESDVLYVTRVQKERFGDQAEYESVKGAYVIMPDTLRRAKEQMIVMHPLPRVGEISMEVDEDPRAAYFRQMEYGLYVRMALLAMVLGKA